MEEGDETENKKKSNYIHVGGGGRVVDEHQNIGRLRADVGKQSGKREHRNALLLRAAIHCQVQNLRFQPKKQTNKAKNQFNSIRARDKKNSQCL